MAGPTINPYNFVPLRAEGPERTTFPGWHRLPGEGYSGKLHCVLEALSPLFSADHQHTSKAPKGQTWFTFLRNSHGEPMLQGTTLKGMIRAVYEALSDACLPLTSTSGTSRRGRNEEQYTFTIPEAYQHTTCADLKTLCAACSLFGVIQGDTVHAQGRLLFSDAMLSQGTLEPWQIRLPELSSPKPYHYEIYSNTRRRGGAIAGRKFFYHHRLQTDLSVTPDAWSTRANGVMEVAPVGSCFAFTLMFHGLTEIELARLVSCLVLEEGLGHKVGMGKPIGFGSCRIHIRMDGSALSHGGTRYQSWTTATLPIDVQAIKAPAGPLSPALQEVLRLDKHMDGPIGYLPFRGYTNVGIDAQGRYVQVWAPPPRGGTTAPPGPSRTGVTLAEQIAMQQSQGKARGGPAASKPLKRNQKIRVEVVAKDGNRYTLRIPGTEQEIVHEALHLPWQVGDRQNVTIVSMEPDGRIKQIRPA